MPRTRRTLAICLILSLGSPVLALPVPIWHNTLDDLAASTKDGGVAEGAAPSFIPGVVVSPMTTINRWQSTADGEDAVTGGSRLFWNTAAVKAIFAGWTDANGITVDLYFSGFGPGVTRDSGLWSVGHRGADNFLIIAIRDDTIRINIRNDSGPDAGGTRTLQTANLGLVAATTYRLTVRQHVGNGNGGDLEVYLDDVGGNQYSNAAPLATLDLVANYAFNFPLETGSGPALGMSIGNRHPFPGSGSGGSVLNAGEAVDEVRVFNGNFTPAMLDVGGEPVAIIHADKTSGFHPLTVNFDGSASRDTDATDVITAYAWDFEDDGTVDATTALTSHGYMAAGSYVARLTVTDNEGETATATVSITVNDPPAAGIVPVTALVPEGSIQSGSQILTSVTAGQDAFTRLVGPTTAELLPEPAGFSAFTNGGLCGLEPSIERGLLGLELGRGVGSLNAADERVRAYFPTDAGIAADGTAKPELFILEYSNSTDNFVVELLSSGPGEEPIIAATVPVRSIDYTATTTRLATGPIGGIGIDLDAVGMPVVKGVQIPGLDAQGQPTGLDLCLIAAVPAPAATFAPVSFLTAAPTTGGRPLTVSFGACGSYDPDGAVGEYSWDFTDNGSTDASGPTVTHDYTAAGTFTARLTVTDAAGLTSSQTVEITVEPSSNPVQIITAVLPEGGPLTGSQWLTAVTAGGNTFTGLVGPLNAEHVEIEGAIGAAAAQGLPDVDAKQALAGLELGDAAQSPQLGEAIRVYFADGTAVMPDGTEKPELFILEWASSLDTFQVELLTSGPGEFPAVAGSVRVSHYLQTSTVIRSKTLGDQPVGGVGIDLDALGVWGIRGIQLPGDDGQGGATGLDPCVVAASVTTCHRPFADADGDMDVDQEDFGLFQACFTGSTGSGYAGACYCLDRDRNLAIDEFDLGAFVECATGPAIPWSAELRPNCQP